MGNGFEQSGEVTGLPSDGQRRRGGGRAPFQVLVLPFHHDAQKVIFAVFKRADAGYWQFIAGGGEGGELPIEAARREAGEEAAIPPSALLFPLDSRNTVPVMELAGRLRWGADVLVVPEYAFAVRITDLELRIRVEHNEYRWVEYETCRELLHWDSNRNALHELNHRILHNMIPERTNGTISRDVS
jgi:dATP pyrophosphohydrolase